LIHFDLLRSSESINEQQDEEDIPIRFAEAFAMTVLTVFGKPRFDHVFQTSFRLDSLDDKWSFSGQPPKTLLGVPCKLTKITSMPSLSMLKS
jgi:hypothetical protein